MDGQEARLSFIHQRNRRAVAASTAFPSFVQFVKEELTQERAAFENGDATEYRRGRICALRDLLRQFPHTGV